VDSEAKSEAKRDWLTKSLIALLPERIIAHADIPLIKFITYFRFRNYYGGWLVFELNGDTYRQYLSWTAACKIFKQDSPFVFKQL
jgi:hypothetical protein